MSRLVLGLAVAAVCLALPQAAAAVLVAEGSAATSSPIAQAGGWLYSPSHVRIQVTASPGAALEVTVDLQCERGRSNRRVQRKVTSSSGSLAQAVKLPLGHPDDCYIDVTAFYASTEQAGEITARVFGHGKLEQ